jgi:hypothetical protein
MRTSEPVVPARLRRPLLLLGPNLVDRDVSVNNAPPGGTERADMIVDADVNVK